MRTLTVALALFTVRCGGAVRPADSDAGSDTRAPSGACRWTPRTIINVTPRGAGGYRLLDDEGRERLLRYVSRPAGVKDRVTERADGRVAYRPHACQTDLRWMSYPPSGARLMNASMRPTRAACSSTLASGQHRADGRGEATGDRVAVGLRDAQPNAIGCPILQDIDILGRRS